MLLFHLDESVALAVASGLRRRGINVTTAEDVGLLSAIDEKHLEFAAGEGRVVLTHDSEFLTLAAAGVPHSGIAYCRPQTRSIGQIISALELLNDCFGATEMANRVEFI